VERRWRNRILGLGMTLKNVHRGWFPGVSFAFVVLVGFGGQKLKASQFQRMLQCNKPIQLRVVKS